MKPTVGYLPFAVVASIIQTCGSIDLVPFWHCLSASSIKSSDSLVTLSKLTKTKNSLSSFNKTVIFHSNKWKWPVLRQLSRIDIKWNCQKQVNPQLGKFLEHWCIQENVFWQVSSLQYFSDLKDSFPALYQVLFL